MVTTKENTDVNGRSIIKHYYTTKEPQKKGNYSQFFSIVSFAGKELARSIHSDRITYLGLSPQSKIASQFKPIVADESKLTQWETVMMDLVEAILRQPDIDPILQVALLRQVVGRPWRGARHSGNHWRPIKNQLDQATVDVNVPWMNPETPRLNQDRTEARFLIQSLPELTSVRKQALARRDQIERGVAHSYQTVGWLVRNADGWHVRSDVAVLPQRDLWVIVYREDKSGEWKRIGTITDGKPKIHTWENSALAEGRPVFVIASSF